MNIILRYLATMLLAVLPAVCTEAQDMSDLEGLYAGFSSDCVVLDCLIRLMLTVLRSEENARWRFKETVTG